MNENIQIINLDDYIQTGEGGTALTYTHKPSTRPCRGSGNSYNYRIIK
jgi:hypothetical protein